MLEKFRQIIIDATSTALNLEKSETEKILTSPPNPEMGDFAFPCFSLAKSLKKAPMMIAKENEPEVNKSLKDSGIMVEAAGPYINFRLEKKTVIKHVIDSILHEKNYIPSPGKGKTVAIDFSSPNIAKPFTMGHLRSTTIGNSLSRIFKSLAYKVVRINHLGDWGTQFGKLICAYRKWGDDKLLKEKEIAYLMEIYVRFNDEAKTNPSFDDEARAAFKELEDGGEEATSLWKKFREISLSEFKRIYKILGIEFDSYAGESFYNDKIPGTVSTIEKKGLLTKSEGALVVDLGESMPPCMIEKSDGATTYAARDLSALFYRKKEYDFAKMLYVVGAPQALHFKQVFTVVEKIDKDTADSCSHIPFGLVLKDGELMSTRKGNVIFLEDVIEEARLLALKKIMEDEGFNEETVTDEIRERASRIAISSIVFFDLKNGRIKDIDFNWDEILNPIGETGVYLQYAHARIHGIMRKFEERLNLKINDLENTDTPVSEEESYSIAKQLAQFPNKILYAADNFEPSVISKYLLDLASTFSTYYKANRVINEDNIEISKERMSIVLAVKKILSEGLMMLGINPMEKM